jgi:hypothetical protein
MKYAFLLIGILLVNLPSCEPRKEEAEAPPPRPTRSVEVKPEEKTEEQKPEEQKTPDESKTTEPGATESTTPGETKGTPPGEMTGTTPGETPGTTTPPGEQKKPEDKLPAPPAGTTEGTTPAEPPASSGTPPAPRTTKTVEVIRYDPNADIVLADRYLDKLYTLNQNRRFNEMRVYVGRLARTLVYLEGHLPSVAVQVGLERAQALLAQDERDKAASEIQRIIAEARSLPSMSPSGNTIASLRDIAENLEGGGDVDTAREALSEIRVSFSSPADPSAVIQEIRSSLTSLEIAVGREAPEVVQTQLTTLRNLLKKLRSALAATTALSKPKT